MARGTRTHQPRYCVREGCGTRLERRPNETTSMFTRRWFCSRWCSAVVREQLERRPPTYHGEPYSAAVRALIRAHPVEFFCLYQSAAVADAIQHDRIETQLIELNDRKA